MLFDWARPVCCQTMAQTHVRCHPDQKEVELVDCWGGDVGLVPEILSCYLNAAVKTNKRSFGSFSPGALGMEARLLAW